MKTRVLFLDDESLALQGLQRLLRNMRASWDMAFVDSGACALDLMEQSPFDIVVTDMLMPGMNGADFLNEIRKRHPHTIRLILSGHAEKDLILQCIGSAHQFLAKPCPPEVLKAALTRVSLLNATLQENDALRRFISQMDRFPSVPSLYIDLAETLLHADVALDEVTKIVIQDPGVTAATLKMVNSGFFGAAREITGMAEAISCLGLDTFKSLAFNLNAFSPFDAAMFREKALANLWHHSVDVAVAARRIAEAEGTDKRCLAAAHTAGLLHDIGKFVMVLFSPERHWEASTLADEQKMPLWMAEQQIFGVSHAETGAYLLGLWGLPPSIVEAVACHHDPMRATAKAFDPLSAVHAANALVQDHTEFLGQRPVSEIDSTYLKQIGRLDRLEVWRGVARDPIAKVC